MLSGKIGGFEPLKTGLFFLLHKAVETDSSKLCLLGRS